MKKNDFRFIRRGKPLHDPTQEEFSLLKPIHQSSTKKDRALLILHGFGSSPAAFRFLIPKITGYDALLCPVLPGHGKSLEDFATVKASDWVAHCREACHRLIQDYKQVDILGLSLGGLLACELSKQCTIHHLYLLAPALKLQLQTNWLLKLTKTMKVLGFTHIRNAAGNIANGLHAELTFRKLPLTTIIEMLRFYKEFQWVIPNCPVDVFLGIYDEVVDSKAVAELFRDQPQTTIHWLKDSAHVLSLDNDLDTIAACINARQAFFAS